MPRRPRKDEPGSWHHVVNRGIAKRPYFENRLDQRFFLARLADQVRLGRIELHAYCLMTTHYHLLVRSPLGQLSEAMRVAQNAYSRRFNRLRRRDGPLIRGRFFSSRVRNDVYRRAVVRYIDANPVRAGIVRTAAEYEFGSAAAHLGAARSPWLCREWVEGFAGNGSGQEASSRERYLRAFPPLPPTDAEAIDEVVEARLASAADIDPLDDLIGATPMQVRSWLARKARLADGEPIGLPVCGPAGLARAFEADLERRGQWLVEDGEAMLRGQELASLGLARTLCALPWPRIAQLHGLTIPRARRLAEVHQRLVHADSAYAQRVAAVVRLAVGRSLALS